MIKSIEAKSTPKNTQKHLSTSINLLILTFVIHFPSPSIDLNLTVEIQT